MPKLKPLYAARAAKRGLGANENQAQQLQWSHSRFPGGEGTESGPIGFREP